MNKTGDIAELKFMLEAVKRDYDVFTPHGHDQKVDVIIMKPGGSPITIQVKKATMQKKAKPQHANSWKFMVGSNRPVSYRTNPIHKKYTNEFHVLAVYIQERNVFSFYLLENIAGVCNKRWNENSSISNNWNIFNTWNEKPIPNKD